MVLGNTKVLVNLSALCHMDLKVNVLLASSMMRKTTATKSGKEMMVMREEHFMFFKTLWMTSRGNIQFLKITIFNKKKLSYYFKIVLFYGDVERLNINEQNTNLIQWKFLFTKIGFKRLLKILIMAT